MFKNLIKAAVGVVITPIALVLDIVTLPASSYDSNRGPFERTAKTLNQVTKAVDAALKPDESNV